MPATPNYSSNLASHARKLMVYAALYAVAVAAIFVGVNRWLPSAGDLQSLIALLPGISLGGFLILLYLYFRQYDEMLKTLLTQSLTASALVGFIVMLGSMVRADTTSFGQVDDALVISLMAVAFIITALVRKWQHR